MSARDEILARVRAALARDKSRTEPGPIPRDYRERWQAPRAEILSRFADRLRDYKVTVLRVADEGSIAAAAAGRFAARGISAALAPADLPEAWLPDGVEIIHEAGQDHRALDRLPAAMTGAAVAIAETGTIALDSGARQGRRVVSLLPDYHLCVVLADQVRGLVPEAVAELRVAALAGRPITLISGPSATSDIELDRVEGVHGPRTLDVLLVG